MTPASPIEQVEERKPLRVEFEIDVATHNEATLAYLNDFIHACTACDSIRIDRRYRVTVEEVKE